MGKEVNELSNKQSKKGFFITFEGCDGCGKSTQSKRLAKFLKAENIDCVLTREPGGSTIAESIRKVLLTPLECVMAKKCESLLYGASRVQHFEEVIRPALAQGKTVICDRFVDSSFAYQGFGRGLGVEYIKDIFELNDGVYPDLTFFIDLPPLEAFERKGGVDYNDRIESEGLEFAQRVYNGFLSLCEMFPKRIVRIDGRAGVDGIFEQIKMEFYASRN